jgi:hypothetical protein
LRESKKQTRKLSCYLSTLRRPVAWTMPAAVTALAFSGMQSRLAGTQLSSNPVKNWSMSLLFSSGCDMSRMMSSSLAWHSTSVCPWNMVLTSGTHDPGRNEAHSNRKPIMSPSPLIWCVGIRVILVCSWLNMLSTVLVSSRVRLNSPKSVFRRGVDMVE